MKKLFWVLIALILLLLSIFIIAGTPFFLNFIKGKLETIVQNETGAPAHIGSLRGNLFYAVEIEEFKIADMVAIDRVRTSYNILKLLSKEIDVNSIVIDGLSADLNRIEEFMKKVKTKKEPPKEKKEAPFVLRIRELSILNSDLFGILNNQEIKVAVAMKGTLLPDIFIIDNLNIQTNESIISARGRIPIKENTDFDLAYNLDILLDEFNIAGVTGRIDGSGEVKGNAASPKILNKTMFDIMYQETQLSGLLAVNWQTPNLDNLNCEFTATAKTTFPSGKEGQKNTWTISLISKREKLLCDITSSYGHLKFVGLLKETLDNPLLDVTLTGAFKYAEFMPKIKGSITYKDNRLTIKDFSLRSKELLVKLNALINNEESPHITSDILLSCNDLGVINNFLQSPKPIRGRLNITTKINGQLDDPHMVSTITLEDVRVYNEQIKNGNFFITLENHIVNIDQGFIQSTRGVVSFTGNYNLENNVFKTRIYSNGVKFTSPEVFGVDTIPMSGQMSFDVNFHGSALNPVGEGKIVFQDFTYDSLISGLYELLFTLKDNTVNLNLVNDKESIRLDADVTIYKPYLFNTVLAFNHFDLTDYIHSDTGYITARFSARGNTHQLEKISGKIHIESLYVAMEKTEFQNAGDVMIDIIAGTVDIRSCIFRLQNDSISVYGTVPLDFENGEINVTCQSSKMNIAQLTAMLPEPPEITGFFKIHIGIKGRLRAPQVNGFARIENIQYTMPNILADSVNGLVTFNNSDITIDHLSGRVNNGSFNAEGFINLSKGKVATMDIDLSCDSIDIEHKDFGPVILTGTVQSSARNDSITINGELTIDKAVYDAPFNLQTIIKLLTRVNRPPPQQHEIVKRIFCDVGISGSDGIKIANNVADVEVGLDLQLKGYLSKLNVYGTISNRDVGIVRYLGKEFEIINAVVEFDNPYKIDPVLNLEAFHFVSTDDVDDDVDYEIFMHLYGTAEKWNLTLKSSPVLPEQDIISLLIMGKRRPSTQLYTQGKKIDLKEAAKEYATSLARKEIEKRAEKVLGLEELTITGDILDPRRLNIGIEKRFAKRFTLIYGMGIESWELHRIGIGLDITDNFSIFTIHDQENMNSSVDFDLHFKLE